MSKRKPIFFSADLHLGHANVISFSKRKFTDTDHMLNAFIKRFNNAIPEGGVCYFLGDMGFNKTDVKKFIDSVHFDCILILGNHDHGANAMYDLGFKAVTQSCSMIIANEVVTISHCPLTGIYREDVTKMERKSKVWENWHKEVKFRRFSFANHDGFHLHGHIHSPNRGISKTKLGRQWDVGVDGNNYMPISISQVESWIVKYKQEKFKK